MVEWLNANASAVQAITTVVIAFLTLVLIAVTGIYTRANWRTMQVMEKDLLNDVQPRLNVRLVAYDSVSTKGKRLRIVIDVENGPAILRSLSVTLSVPEKKLVEKITVEEATFRMVVNGCMFHADPKLVDFEHWVAQVDFSDGLNLFKVRGLQYDGFPMTTSAKPMRPPGFFKRLWAPRR